MRQPGDIMADPRAGESISDLIREAIGEVKDWVRAEIELARAQVLNAVGEYAAAAVAWVLAALFALLALIYLGFALVLLLSPYIGNVAAALAVGLAMLVAAVAAFLYGRARFLSARIVPPRLARLLSQDNPVKRKAEP
jgi:Putative Actinobacterial Holin-X, holin superfamily III